MKMKTTAREQEHRVFSSNEPHLDSIRLESLNPLVSQRSRGDKRIRHDNNLRTYLPRFVSLSCAAHLAFTQPTVPAKSAVRRLFRQYPAAPNAIIS